MAFPTTARQKPVYDSALRPRPAIEELQELVRCRELIRQWTLRNIKLRYKRSVLGVLWTLLEPLMLMTILGLVFSAAFRFEVENFPVYLLPGLLLFDFFNRSTLQMIADTIESNNLASRLYVPRSAFAVSSALTFLVNWMIALIPLAGIMLFFGQPITWALLTVPAGMLLTSLFALGIGLLVSTLGAFFHDVRITYQVLLTGWFYITPIFYPVEVVPENLQNVYGCPMHVDSHPITGTPRISLIP